jgi:nucleotide-binding universal stress UspA family protein
MTLPAVRRIVVGVDGSAESEGALRWACREARLRRAEVHVVRAWETPQRVVASYAWSARIPGQSAGVGTAREDLLRMVRSVAEPGVAIRADVVEGLPARVLLDQAIGADMLVLGSASHPHTQASGPVLRACVSRAPCPVVVIGTAQGTQGTQSAQTAQAAGWPDEAPVPATAGGWVGG